MTVTRAYAIGDVHGHLDLLAGAHRLIAADRRMTGDATAPVIHVGDLVDRGPESAEVIEFLIAGPTGPAPWITLKGNHDYMFELFLRDPALRDPGLRPDLTWLHYKLGGPTTLASYGIEGTDRRAPADLWSEAMVRVPSSHQAFLRDMALFHHLPGLFLVHAGIRPGVPLDRQAAQDMLWIRKDFHNSTADHGALIVHGHTPVEHPTLYANRLNIDTGAAYGGPLAAVVIEDGAVWHLTPDGRIALHPEVWERV